MSHEKWYRYVDIQYSPGVDEWDNILPGPGRVDIRCEDYLVAKHTPKGVWLSESVFMLPVPKNAKLPCDRFVLKNARKRFACPTKGEAMESFIARKKRQLKILNAQKHRVESALEQAIRMPLQEDA